MARLPGLLQAAAALDSITQAIDLLVGRFMSAAQDKTVFRWAACTAQKGR